MAAHGRPRHLPRTRRQPAPAGHRGRPRRTGAEITEPDSGTPWRIDEHPDCYAAGAAKTTLDTVVTSKVWSTATAAYAAYSHG